MLRELTAREIKRESSIFLAYSRKRFLACNAAYSTFYLFIFYIYIDFLYPNWANIFLEKFLRSKS